MTFLDVTDIYPNIKPILNEVCSMFSSFAGTMKTIALHYGK